MSLVGLSTFQLLPGTVPDAGTAAFMRRAISKATDRSAKCT